MVRVKENSNCSLRLLLLVHAHVRTETPAFCSIDCISIPATPTPPCHPRCSPVRPPPQPLHPTSRPSQRTPPSPPACEARQLILHRNLTTQPPGPRSLLARFVPWPTMPGDWSGVLSNYAKLKHPETELPEGVCVHVDDHTISIVDGYEKAKFHFLILRECIDRSCHLGSYQTSPTSIAILTSVLVFSERSVPTRKGFGAFCRPRQPRQSPQIISCTRRTQVHASRKRRLEGEPLSHSLLHFLTHSLNRPRSNVRCWRSSVGNGTCRWVSMRTSQ